MSQWAVGSVIRPAFPDFSVTLCEALYWCYFSSQGGLLVLPCFKYCPPRLFSKPKRCYRTIVAYPRCHSSIKIWFALDEFPKKRLLTPWDAGFLLRHSLSGSQRLLDCAAPWKRLLYLPGSLHTPKEPFNLYGIFNDVPLSICSAMT